MYHEWIWLVDVEMCLCVWVCVCLKRYRIHMISKKSLLLLLITCWMSTDMRSCICIIGDKVFHLFFWCTFTVSTTSITFSLISFNHGFPSIAHYFLLGLLTVSCTSLCFHPWFLPHIFAKATPMAFHFHATGFSHFFQSLAWQLSHTYTQYTVHTVFTHQLL